MSSFTCTVDLPNQPSDLFCFLAEPRNRPLWQSTLRTVTDIDNGEPHPGMQWRDITKFGLRPWMELTDLVPFRLLAEAGSWHGVDGLLTMRFLKVSSGTRVNVEGRLIGRGPFAVAVAASGRWAPLTVQKDLQRASTAILERQSAAD
ncbi:MAG: hypothetical protein ACR2K3_12780 [Nocardioides sp.]